MKSFSRLLLIGAFVFFVSSQTAEATFVNNMNSNYHTGTTFASPKHNEVFVPGGNIRFQGSQTIHDTGPIKGNCSLSVYITDSTDTNPFIEHGYLPATFERNGNFYTCYWDYTTVIPPTMATGTKLAFVYVSWYGQSCTSTVPYACPSTNYGAIGEHITVDTSVTPSTAPALTIWADRPVLPVGATTTIRWSSANVTSCTASLSWSGSKPVNGTEVSLAMPGGTTSYQDYRLACTGPGGSITKTLRINKYYYAVWADIKVNGLDNVDVASGSTITAKWCGATPSACGSGYVIGDDPNCTVSGGGAGWYGDPITKTLTVTTNRTLTLTCTNAYSEATDVALVNILRTLTVATAGTGTGSITGTGINCPGDCTEAITGSVVLTATPTGGSSIASWSGGGCSGTGTTCTVNMTADQSVTVTFNPPPSYTVNVTKSGSGTVTQTAGASSPSINCGTTCATSVVVNNSITLQATPSAGYVFSGWSGSGCSGTGTCTITVTGNSSVNATFSTGSYTLTVTKAGTGTGTVTSGGGSINCGSTCSASGISGGTSVTLTATPTGGSTFAGWSGGTCSGASTTCTFTMNSNIGVTATFNPPPSYTLSVTKAGAGAGTVTSGGGSINCGSTCSTSVVSGTSVTLTATPNAGSSFAGWSGACSGTGTCNVTVTSNTAVTATFDIAPVLADLTATTLTSNPSQIVERHPVTFTARINNAAGGSNAAPFYVRFQVDVNNNGTTDVTLPATYVSAGLNAGQFTNVVSAVWANPPAGTHRIIACADSTGTVAESNESNNCTNAVGNPPSTGVVTIQSEEPIGTEQ